MSYQVVKPKDSFQFGVSQMCDSCMLGQGMGSQLVPAHIFPPNCELIDVTLKLAAAGVIYHRK